MTEHERLIAMARARKFAQHLRSERWAEFVPDDWETMTDEQIKYALEQLPSFGVVRRADWRWEAP